MDKKDSDGSAVLPALNHPSPPPSSEASSLPTPIVRPPTPEEVKQLIEIVIQRFYWLHPLHTLNLSFRKNWATDITQCICLGLGRFMRFERKDNESFNAPLRRLAMLEMLLGGLKKGEEFQVYFQDPDFTQLERDYLESCGYIVLQGDSGLTKMSTSTFLYAPFPPFPVISRALMYSPPALYIGLSIDEAIDGIYMYTEEELCGPRETFVLPLLQFKRSFSYEAQRLPIFATQGTKGGEIYASVRWLMPGYGEANVADLVSKEGGKGETGSQSTLKPSGGDQGKGKKVLRD